VQLTLRGLDGPLEQYIREIAEKEGISLNKAALRLLRRGAGLVSATQTRPRIGHRLDEFIGGWDKDRAREVLEATAACEVVDEDFWQ
jgi:hypothetical protein